MLVPFGIVLSVLQSVQVVKSLVAGSFLWNWNVKRNPTIFQIAFVMLFPCSFVQRVINVTGHKEI